MLDFATSSDLLATVANYLKFIPALSTTLPPGIRFVESNAAFDDQPDHPKDSQLYHIDYYSLPNVYVIVLLRDVTPEHGPWTFLPRSVSQKAAGVLGPREVTRERQEYRAIEDMNSVIRAVRRCSSILRLAFQYGSRNSVKPRFQLMLGYAGVCRTDFSEAILPPKVYPIHPTDSRLRKMVLSKNILGI